jgi:hypothetical protein
MNPMQSILGRLERVTGGPSQFMAKCPAHEDRHASLSVGLGDDGRALLSCKAGCSIEMILVALDLHKADLFLLRADVPRHTKRRANNQPSATIYQTPAEAAEALTRQLKAARGGSWTYYGVNGTEALTVLRFNLPDGGKTFRPIHRHGGGWSIGDPDGPLPLYRLGELNGAPRVCVVEGERCADEAARLGLTATTSAHGAEAPHKTDWRPLAGLDVVILPDCDKPGEDYAANVANILTRLDPPARVRIVRLPGLPEHGDIVDWLSADGVMDAKDGPECREAIDALAAAAPPWTPPAKAETPPADAETEHGVFVRLSEVAPQPVRWLWPGRIARGKLCIFAGPPGVGKSCVTHLRQCLFVTLGRSSS